jgi:hypothetical protein
MAFDSNLEQLNTVHITDNIHNYEAARSGFFVFLIDPNDLKPHLAKDGTMTKPLYKPDFDPDSAATYEDSDIYEGGLASDYIRLNCVKAPVPGFSVETKQYRRGNDVVNYAGVPNFKDGSIVVDDVVGLGTKNLLYSWLYLVYNPITRKGGRMKDYKKKCTLLEYTQDYELIRIWTLEGCFPTDIQEGDFDKENDDRRQLTIPLKYDRATFKLPNEA